MPRRLIGSTSTSSSGPQRPGRPTPELALQSPMEESFALLGASEGRLQPGGAVGLCWTRRVRSRRALVACGLTFLWTSILATSCVASTSIVPKIARGSSVPAAEEATSPEWIFSQVP